MTPYETTATADLSRFPEPGTTFEDRRHERFHDRIDIADEREDDEIEQQPTEVRDERRNDDRK